MPPQPPDPLLGRTVDGRYRVVAPLGKGGMATVYRAIDERSGATIALKVLRRDLTKNALVLRRFEREAKAAQKLRHPNILEVFAWGVEGETAYIAMQLAEGRDLLRTLARERPMRQDRAARLVAQVCSALALAHASGIVHRDLKPENVMVVPDADAPGGERAVVLDFGIAKVLAPPKPENATPEELAELTKELTRTALTRAGTIVGTPAYMSPEQCKGAEVDGRSDLYTCGVLLYQLLTGELPFVGESPLHTAMKHLQAEPRRPSELRSDLDPELERVVTKALSKQPKDRYQTADELRADLLRSIGALGDGLSPEARVPAAPRPDLSRIKHTARGPFPKITPNAAARPEALTPERGPGARGDNDLGASPLGLLRLGASSGPPRPTPSIPTKRSSVGSTPTPSSSRELEQATDPILPNLEPSETTDTGITANTDPTGLVESSTDPTNVDAGPTSDEPRTIAHDGFPTETDAARTVTADDGELPKTGTFDRALGAPPDEGATDPRRPHVPTRPMLPAATGERSLPEPPFRETAGTEPARVPAAGTPATRVPMAFKRTDRANAWAILRGASASESEAQSPSSDSRASNARTLVVEPSAAPPAPTDQRNADNEVRMPARTLVMEPEPPRAAPAPPAPRELTSEQLRAIRSTTKMTPGVLASLDPHAASALDQMRNRAQTPAATPSLPGLRPPPPALTEEQMRQFGHLLQALPPSGFGDETIVSRRRASLPEPAAGDDPRGASARLRGTTGLLIGIGLGVGIAAGAVIAILLFG